LQQPAGRRRGAVGLAVSWFYLRADEPGEICNAHSWTRDEIQLQRIAEAINQHAAKELVTTDGRTLSPL
jgi:hypothetical protein